MFSVFLASRIATVISYAALVYSLGTTCTTPLGSGTAAPADPFWMQNIKHQGIAAFNPNSTTYQVFRNVMDFGAKGDGITDDTVAINAAISTGNRCGGGSCPSSTTTPAVVFFPYGTYVVSAPIIAYYYTQLIGDAMYPPTLLAAPDFGGIGADPDSHSDADPYIANGQFYDNTNNFFRSVRNFIIDLTQIPASSAGTGLHWQVAQATSLMNLVINMSTEPDTAHQGLVMENGSGGFMGDLVFNGGKIGMSVGNQQFTVRNVTVNNAQTGILAVWNWGWTFQGVTFNNCQIGFDLSTGGGPPQPVAAEAIIDATGANTPIFLRTSANSGQLDGSLVLNNIKLTNVPTAIGLFSGDVLLAGGTTTITSWGQGNIYTGSNGTGTYTQGYLAAPNKPAALLDSAGNIFGRTHPQYAHYAVNQFVSVRDQGAKGDGVTDDTAALQEIFAAFAGCKIIFFDAGTYIVTSTLTIPAGTQMVGEAWSVISGKGSTFQDMNNPQPVVQVGAPGSSGLVEITDIIFSTIGPAGGAIVVEWNVKQTTQGGTGMWDSHIRLGGAAGTNLQAADCPSNGDGGTTACLAAFAALHLTSESTAYLEGTWVWLADHDLDEPGGGQDPVSIYSGRGILSESAGPVWLIGTASEHHIMYQYNLANAKAHYMGLIQTETPYFQPNPVAPAPFTVNMAFKDPAYWSDISQAWGLWVTSSEDILVFGASLYSFYSNYDQGCLTTESCQSQMVNVDNESSVNIYSLSTIGATWQLSINQATIINQDQNQNGLASTVTSWNSS
ncbi:exo-beta-1,3-glucanase [Mycena maculata]|uniref:Exo-beta-1,3-glucanase n=1 Tax=Mycena maculata TaxID=230809 RepID=A0AAD7JA28_9AGAR|nr:exo-beta-1,3-glucanase [Mycena maculata]